MDYMKEFNNWLESNYFDEATKEELLKIKEDPKEIEDRFYKDLEFGTGGLRGIIGAGTNRINIYTVRKTTQGLANYIKMHGEEALKKGVAIAYDSRHMSPEFAEEAALVLNGNGIKSYLFESLRATPQLSFAVRELGCIAGIVITASHNPPEYNGYKVYWEDGAQVTSPKDVEIINEVKKVTSFEEVKVLDQSVAKEQQLFNLISESVDDRYIVELKKQIINPNLIKDIANDFTIVYTPLHGTGNIPVRRILEETGFKNVYVVPEQEMPDSNFTTVSYPNPEDIKAFELAIKLGKEKNADVILATDPDADRLGVLAKNKDGDYYPLTGNMIGVLLAEYIITQKKEKGSLPSNGVIIDTIVSTNMIKAIAKKNNVELLEVLTGFKYIGEKIKEFEETGSYEYLFGFEESYGYLVGTHARDKDAIVSTMLVCELAGYYKAKGLTLYEGLVELYEKYGYYKETLKSLTFKGVEGVEKIQSILTTLRKDAPTELAGLQVVEAIDYLNDATDLPKSNVLYFELENDTWFCVRPSGTEPKIKFYFGSKGNSLEDVNVKLEDFTTAVMSKVDEIIG